MKEPPGGAAGVEDEVLAAARALTAPPDAPPRNDRVRWRLPLVLFLATIATTTLAGGAAFSATLMAILVAHEMGHYVVARRHGVGATLPHFIPLPPFFMLGTMGAIIEMDTDRAPRRALLDIGAAGPIAGFVVAVPAMILGLYLSDVRPLADYDGPLLQFGDSLVSALLTHLIHPDIPAGSTVWAHPVQQAAWAGLFVTTFNLLPMGQFDGGHIAAAISPRRAGAWSRATFAVMVVLGAVGLVFQLPAIAFSLLRLVGAEHLVPIPLLQELQAFAPYTSFTFLVWAALARYTGLEHPPIPDPETPLGRGHWVTAAVCLVIAVATFMPSPAWNEDIWKKPIESSGLTSPYQRPGQTVQDHAKYPTVSHN